MSGFSLIKKKATSKAKIKRYAEIGSPCLVPLSNLKYGVVFIKICIHFRKSLPNPFFFFDTDIKKQWLIEKVKQLANQPQMLKKNLIGP